MVDNKALQEEAQSVAVNLPPTSSSPLKRKCNSDDDNDNQKDNERDNERDCEDTKIKSNKRPKVVLEEPNITASATVAITATATSTAATTSSSSTAIKTISVVTPISTTTSVGSHETASIAAVPSRTKATTAAAAKSGSASASTSAKETDTLDLAKTLGLKAGAQIEVQWEIHNENDDENDDENDGKQSAASEKNARAGGGTADIAATSDDPPPPAFGVHWWKATMLEYDGRTTDSVAVRSLLYEARPDLGFPEPSTEDVVFLGTDVLATATDLDAGDWEKDPDAVRQMPYRRVHNNDNPDEVFYYNDDQLDDQLNGLLMGAFQKNQQAWKAMPAAQQAVIAEMIQKKKEELKEAIRAEAKHKVITPETIKEILARTF